MNKTYTLHFSKLQYKLLRGVFVFILIFSWVFVWVVLSVEIVHAQTRFYLPSSGTPPLPALGFSASWEDTSIGDRFLMPTAKTSTAMTTVSFLDNNGADKDILFRQYQSGAIAAQTISAQTVKFQIRGALTSAGNGMFTAINARVVSNDGNTVRGTLFDVTRDNTLLTTTLTNRQFTVTSAQVISQANDRIVIEIGTGGDPAGGDDHDSDLRIGDVAASDLPEDNTTTTDLNPWVEFTNTITFFVEEKSSLIQHSYKWFANTDSTAVGGAAGANSPTIAPKQGTPFRLRLLLYNKGGTSIGVSGTTTDIMIALKDSDGICDGDETYSEVQSASGVIRYYNNATPADGDNLTASGFDPGATSSAVTVRNQDYEESNTFTNSVAAIAENEAGLWDFSLVDSAAPPDTTYCFRAMQDQGGTNFVLSGYDTFPEITTAKPVTIRLRAEIRLRTVRLR